MMSKLVPRKSGDFEARVTDNPKHEGHSWTEKSFDDALMSLALKYCSTSACQEQKRFMKRRLGLPNNYLTATLLNRLQQFNRYISHTYRESARSSNPMTSEKGYTKPYRLTYTSSYPLPTTSGRMKQKLTARSVLTSIDS